MRRNARMRAHAHADDRYFGNVFLDAHALCADLGHDFFHDLIDLFCIGPGHGKGHVRKPSLADVLNDHIHDHRIIGDGIEDFRGNARFVRHPLNRHFHLVLVVGHSGHHYFFHIRILPGHQRSRVIVKAREHPQRHMVFFRKLNGAGLEHLGAQARQFKHLVIGNFVKLSGLRHHVRVRSVYAVHVRIDVAQVRLERRGDRHGRKIGAAAPQGRHIIGPFRDPLETRHHGDLPLAERLFHTFAGDLFDPRLRMDVV